MLAMTATGGWQHCRKVRPFDAHDDHEQCALGSEQEG